MAHKKAKPKSKIVKEEKLSVVPAKKTILQSLIEERDVKLVQHQETFKSFRVSEFSEQIKLLSNPPVFQHLANELMSFNQSLTKALSVFDSKSIYKDIFPALDSYNQWAKQISKINFLPSQEVLSCFTQIKLAQASIISSGLSEQIQSLTLGISQSASMIELARNATRFNFPAYEGLIVKSDSLVKDDSFINNFYSSLKIETAELLEDDQVEFNISRKKENQSSIIAYTDIVELKVSVNLLNDKFESSTQEIRQLREEVRENNLLKTILQNNPFPFFRINSMAYTKENSHFIINGCIYIQIPSGTLQDYICKILFSNGPKKLSKEWLFDQLKRKVPLLGSDDKYYDLTWKQIQEAIDNINEKIASETTLKDVIHSPRQYVIQLNPKYFL